jgi:HPt (histidine-containing phosphotransfer) domain-containing protein
MSAMDPTEVFRQEASELFEVLEGALLDLGQRPDDRELVDSAFRALHTIKGSGAMFGFDKVASFTHEFETAFDPTRPQLRSPRSRRRRRWPRSRASRPAGTFIWNSNPTSCATARTRSTCWKISASSVPASSSPSPMASRSSTRWSRKTAI